MVPSIRMENECHAAVSRLEEWQVCCAHAMGYNEWILVDSNAGGVTDQSEGVEYLNRDLHVTNLLPSDLFEDEVSEEEEAGKQSKAAQDPWTESALNVQADLERMSNWIHSKKWSFISFDGMRDEEASLVQSTVTSFAATTANEIESLRKMTMREMAGNSNALNHRTGIVQILLARLKEDIVAPFAIMQKHRSRKAVNLWQNPLQCKLLVKTKAKKRKKADEIDQALGLDDEEEDAIENSRREQQFLPLRNAHNLRSNFMETYKQDEDLPKQLKRPKSLVRNPLSALSSDSENVSYMPAKERSQESTQAFAPNLPDFSVTDEMNGAAQVQMQQEAVLLEAVAHSDLDSVQKMEQQMISITSLLTQFSDLVSEQQEEVWHIHDSAQTTKDNMNKGQENLVDAAERTYRSKHYKAKAIFALSCLLLLFHWLRP